MPVADPLTGRVIETEHGLYRVIGGVRWSELYVELEAVNPPPLGQHYRKTVRRTDQMMRTLGIEPTRVEEDPVGRVVHCKREPYDILIDRSTPFGNPYSHKEGTAAQYVVATREEAIEMHREWLRDRVRANEPGILEWLASLYGKTLGCWCAPKACHGDNLVDAAAWAAGVLAERLTSAPN